MVNKVPIVDLSREFKKYEKDLIEIFIQVGRSGQYVAGESVEKFEQEFAEFIGVNYAVSCGNASDGLEMALEVVGVSCGSEVITAANSFISSGGSIYRNGALPVFADVNDDLNINIESVERNITELTSAMPVHLTGRAADMEGILETC